MSMIFLVGMPAAGKTYWAAHIASVYAYSMIDLDSYIEEQEGKNVQQIFKENGEAYFRNKETEALIALSKENLNNNIVVACGGGTPAYNNNMQLMLDNGCVVYLKTGIEQLMHRVQDEPDKRPLLIEGDLKEKLTQLHAQREQYYTLAHYTLETDTISIKDFDKIIQLCTEQQ